MHEQLSEEMQQQLRAWCGDMVSGNESPGTVIDELYGHMEDKMLAYMHGEETITEEDAFLLASERFGDVSTLREQLQGCNQKRAGSFPVRKYFSTSVFAILVSFIVCAPVVHILSAAILSSVPERFILVMAHYPNIMVKLKYSVVTSLGAVLPILFILYHQYRAPDSYSWKKWRIIRSALSVSGIFIVGMALCSIVVIPRLMTFLAGLTQVQVQAMISVTDALSTNFNLALMTGAVLAAPWALFCFHREGMLDLTVLQHHHVSAVITACILGAILTPPDPVSMIMTAIPLIISFEIALLLPRLVRLVKVSFRL